MAQTTPNTRPSPLARVKSEFGGKKELVEKLKSLATSDLWANEASDDKQLGSISNAKLLHLFSTLTEAKTRFTTRDKLIEAVVTAQGRAKDQDYRKHFAGWSVARLFDSLKAHEKAARADERKSKGAKAEVKSEKPAAKAAAPAKSEKPAKAAKPAAAPAKAEAKPAAKAKKPAKA